MKKKTNNNRSWFFKFILTGSVQVILLFFISFSSLAALKTGDIVVVMEEAVFPASPVKLLKVDPQTGQQTEIASLDDYEGEPGGIVIDTNGEIFLTLNPLSSADDPSGKIIKVDSNTGEATLFAAGDLLSDPNDLALDPNGNLIIAQPGQVVSIDRTTAEQTLVSSFGNLIEPEGISVAPNGTIFVADNGAERVVSVTPTDGNQTIVFNRTNPVGGPVDSVIDASGNLLVLQFGNIVQVDQSTKTPAAFIAGDSRLGDQTLRNVGFRSRMASESNSSLVVAFDNFTESGVARVDVGSGAVTIVTISPEDSRGFTGIAVVKDRVTTGLGAGVELAPNGVSVASEATFEGGVSVESGEFANAVSINQPESFSLAALITVDPKHIGQTADLLAVVSYVSGQNTNWFMKSGENFVTWDSNPGNLVATQSNITLNATQTLNIFEGSLAGTAPGVFNVFVGYRLNDGTIVFNGNQAIIFSLLGN